MAEQDEQAAQEVTEAVAEQHEEEDEEKPNYIPPAPKALNEIVNTDADDESLRKYKEALLGQSAKEVVVIDPNKDFVILDKITLVFNDHESMALDLNKPPEELKQSSFTLKEGVSYRIEITFFVQKDIVTGLKYEHKVYRKGMKVDKMDQMMGSYGPKHEAQKFTTLEDEAPKGFIARGEYKIKSKFVDDDGKEYATWEWNLSIKKDW